MSSVWAAFDFDVDLGLVTVDVRKIITDVRTMDVRKIDVDFVLSAVMRSVDLEMGLGVFVMRSLLFAYVDVFSAAFVRTVTILSSSYVDFFLAESLVPRRKIGGVRRVFVFPSDACW